MTTILRSLFRKVDNHAKKNAMINETLLKTIQLLQSTKRRNCMTRNERSKPKCYNYNNFGYILRDCPLRKPVITCQTCNKTSHVVKNCVIKLANNNFSNRSLSVGQDGKN
ncbi:hypothetical protein NPIL_148521 [Nephila pilipes]|uniref:Uncharacterized protein n=1 Tax=Nephila pilipes TaxID=299642 RepID=A0A8X6QYN7_NEPPI|nr:hypothetical protein NPIL_148521 [Nephila pilipes]